MKRTTILKFHKMFLAFMIAAENIVKKLNNFIAVDIIKQKLHAIVFKDLF